MPHHSHYAEDWDQARTRAIHSGLRIIEHGWEQHVIIDESNGIVYRYPRHDAAAAKLQDEVLVLQEIHKHSWPIQLPIMLEHNELFTSYTYIPGEAATKDWLDSFTAEDCIALGNQLGIFLGQLHELDVAIVNKKQTKQSMTLLDYYTARIQGAASTSAYSAAAEALSRLTTTDVPEVVLHGDLHGLNMILNPATRDLTGVIDLSEMEVGDPHQDFRKLFMSDSRLLEPAIAAYGRPIDADRVRLWAYVNEWANLCYFADTPTNPTYQRALHHLQHWQQI